MRCANSNCRAAADDILKGTLRMVEFETTPENRILRASGGFPVCSARTRYFWLCAECSRLFTIKKWNSSGVVLQPLAGLDLSAPAMAKKPASQVRPAHENTGGKVYRLA